MTVKELFDTLETNKPIMTFDFDSGGHEFWFDLTVYYTFDSEPLWNKEVEKVVIDDSQIEIYYNREDTHYSWEPGPDEFTVICPVCKEKHNYSKEFSNYCPKCGTKMEV